MAFRSSTTNNGSSSTPAATVPAGLRSGDVVIIVVNDDSGAWTYAQNTWPDGFTLLERHVQATPDGQSNAIGWKQIIGNDSGTYAFKAQSSSVVWSASAIAFSSRGQPTFTSNASTASNTSPVSITATGIQANDGDDLLWVAAPDITVSGGVTGLTPPSGFTTQVAFNSTFNYIGAATLNDVAGSLTSNAVGQITLSSGSAGWQSWLLRIPSQSTFHVGRVPMGI